MGSNPDTELVQTVAQIWSEFKWIIQTAVGVVGLKLYQLYIQKDQQEHDQALAADRQEHEQSKDAYELMERFNDRLQDANERLENEKREVTEKNFELQAKLQKTTEELRDAVKENTKISKELQNSYKERRELSTQIESLQAQMNHLQTKLETEMQEQQRYIRTANYLFDQVTTLTTSIQKLVGMVDRLRDDLGLPPLSEEERQRLTIDFAKVREYVLETAPALRESVDIPSGVNDAPPLGPSEPGAEED
jgi:signal transduction histidine kinase